VQGRERERNRKREREREREKERERERERKRRKAQLKIGSAFGGGGEGDGVKISREDAATSVKSNRQAGEFNAARTTTPPNEWVTMAIRFSESCERDAAQHAIINSARLSACPTTSPSRGL
jgi:hypothetical protein